MSLRVLVSLAFAAALAACASVGGAKDDALSLSNLPRYPACDAEMKAFIALIKLAKQMGENWHVYEPALQALQEQIIDCVDDNYPDPVPI